MKQVLQQRLGQHLAMTPQMQQALRLLQIPAVELKLEIQDALESNLMLELVEDEDGPEVDDSPEDLDELPETVTSEWDEPGTDWSSEPTSSAAGSTTSGDWPVSSQQSLHDYLRWQMELTPFGEVDARIAETIIDSIDDDGYLHVDLGEIAAILAPIHVLEVDEIEAVLHRIQRFDPVGVAARSLSECLLVQLRHLPARTATVGIAERIVGEHLELLGQHDLDALIKVLGVDAAAVAQAADLVRTLNPRPGSGIGDEDVGFIIPDILVTRRDDRWVVELNPDLIPKLRINPYYAELARTQGDEQDKACMRDHLQEARWLLRSLRTRADTLLQVATFIVRHQQDWLDQGDTAMKPLVLREVADALDIHESTVSRATAGKYINTPRGTHDFRHFFSTGLALGTGASATAVRAQIKRLIAAEDRKKPLSDGNIAELLAGMGLQVARRTVAKYRESMSIPATPDRRAGR